MGNLFIAVVCLYSRSRLSVLQIDAVLVLRRNTICFFSQGKKANRGCIFHKGYRIGMGDH